MQDHELLENRADMEQVRLRKIQRDDQCLKAKKNDAGQLDLSTESQYQEKISVARPRTRAGPKKASIAG